MKLFASDIETEKQNKQNTNLKSFQGSELRAKALPILNFLALFPLDHDVCDCNLTSSYSYSTSWLGLVILTPFTPNKSHECEFYDMMASIR